MLISSEYLVLLLILPVTVFIIIPLIMFICWMIVSGTKELFFAPKVFTDKTTEIQSENGLQPSEA